jgi:hypothetical protein
MVDHRQMYHYMFVTCCHIRLTVNTVQILFKLWKTFHIQIWFHVKACQNNSKLHVEVHINTLRKFPYSVTSQVPGHK